MRAQLLALQLPAGRNAADALEGHQISSLHGKLKKSLTEDFRDWGDFQRRADDEQQISDLAIFK